MDRSLRDRLSRFAVERRRPDDRWVRIGLFGTAGEAAENIDVLVAMHGGPFTDYRIARVGFRKTVAVAGWVTIALMVVATITGWIFLSIH